MLECVSGRRRHRPGPNIAQRAVQPAEYEVVHVPGLAEAHLVLCGMHVDIHFVRRQFEIQCEERMPAVEQHIAIGLADGVSHQLVAHHPAVDEEILPVGLPAGVRRQTDPAMQAQTAAFFVDGETAVDKLRPQHRPQARRCISGGHGLPLRPYAQFHADVEAGQRQAPQHGLHLLGFGAFALQEAAPGRRVVEQVFHLHGGAGRVAPGSFACHLAAVHGDVTAHRLIAYPAGDGEPGHRRDAGERLAPETQASDAEQVADVRDLAGRMPADGKRQVVRMNPVPVVDDAHPFDAPLLDQHFHAAGARIEAVLDEFLDDRGRTLHHLAGSDLVGDELRQQGDAVRQGSPHL